MWACPSEVADFDGVPIPGFFYLLCLGVFFLLGFGLDWFERCKRHGGAFVPS